MFWYQSRAAPEKTCICPNTCKHQPPLHTSAVASPNRGNSRPPEPTATAPTCTWLFPVTPPPLPNEPKPLDVRKRCHNQPRTIAPSSLDLVEPTAQRLTQQQPRLRRCCGSSTPTLLALLCACAAVGPWQCVYTSGLIHTAQRQPRLKAQRSFSAGGPSRLEPAAYIPHNLSILLQDKKRPEHEAI